MRVVPFRLSSLPTVLAAVCLLASAARSGEFEVTLDGPQRQFTVENPGPAVVPTIYLVGRPDRSTDPVRKTKGLTLDRLRLTETLLSESVLILYPDGTGKWGYYPGFDIFRGPQLDDDGRQIDPRSLVEYDKWKYDPLGPVRCVGGDMNLLLLHGAGPMPPAVYEIAFPEPIKIHSLEVRSNCDQIRTPGVAVAVRLFADRDRKELIAERSAGPDADEPRFPLRFDGLDCGRVYLELSAQAPRGTSVGLYYTMFEATLDTGGLELPVLQPGENGCTLSDDAESSHRARLVLRWEDRPTAEPVKKPPERELPEKIASYVSPLSGVEPPDRPIPPIQEWFPLGFYDGTASRSDRECQWLFDQMRRLSMNTVYISNGSLEGLRRIVPLAEARGIRLIHQGGSDGSLYYLHLATPEARRRSMDRVILPRVREWVPKFRGRFGLLAWSLTEEIGPELSAELSPYYGLVRELDPEHPPTVLHNNLAAAKVDLETNRPLVITHDFYPFFWCPRSGPSNPGRSIAMYRSRVAGYYKACREHGASLWMMPQAWGQEETAPLDPPNYGYRQGMRTPEPGEIKLQGWVAVAEGATGLMYYAAVARRPGQHQLWDRDWTETANTRAAGELFAQVRRVGPLLCRLERDYREEGFVATGNPRVLAHSFVKRPGYEGDGRYVVLASLDGFGPQSFSLEIDADGRVWDMVRRREMTQEPADWTLEAGDGTLLLVGSQDQFEADCRLLDRELAKWEGVE